MTQRQLRWHQPLRSLLIAGVLTLFPISVVAQLRPIADETLGNERSIVSPDQVINGLPSNAINGGARRGSNLFHSFREFNIDVGRGVYFTNPAGVANILTRVTGGNPSQILGRLGVLGNANLFLINPNGILFGANAQLDVRGSFVASAASSFKFLDGSEFSATNPQTPALLTINVPLGLQYGKAVGDIQQAGSLAVPEGQSLTLHGNVVTNTGTLTASGGTVQVLGDRVALLGNARVDVSSPTGSGSVSIGGNHKGQGNLPNALQTYVAPTATINADATSTGNGGNVVVWADDTTRFYGSISARGGTQAGNGGFVEVSGARSLIFNGFVDTSAPSGMTGTLLLDPTNIRVVPGNFLAPINAADGIWSATEDPGDQAIGAGTLQRLLNQTSLTLEATNSIGFAPGINILANSANTLTLHARTINLTNVSLIQRGGGNIVLDTTPNRNTPAQTTQGTSVVIDGGSIGTENVGTTPQSGDIRITTENLTVINGAQLTTSTAGVGDAGSVKLTVNGVATFDGTTPDGQDSTGAFSQVNQRARGKGGTIELTAGSLTVSNGAQLGTATQGVGDAGNVKLTVSGAAIFDGTAPNNVQFTSGAFSQVQGGNGRGGTLELSAGSLTVSNGAALSVSTFGVGDAGSVKLTVNGAAIFDGTNPNGQVLSGAFSQVNRRARGKGGTIELTADSLTVSNGAALSASTVGVGDAGSVKLTVNGAAIFDGTAPNNAQVTSGAGSVVSRGATGKGGTVELTAGSLTVSNGAVLITNTFGVGDAGNVKLRVNGAAIFDGTTPNGRSPSGALSQVNRGANGRGGTVELTAGSLTVVNGGQVSVVTEGQGNAGKVIIMARDAVFFDGVSSNGSPGGAFSSVGSGAVGQGGDITVQTGLFSITNGGQLSASSNGQGGAGNLDVNARQLRLDNQGSIQAQTASGQGGNITLQVQDLLLLRRGSFISTNAGTAQAGGDGGNITFKGNFIVAVPNENSDISANAFTGSGGRVNINAQGIFGIQFRPQLTPLSDITASSDFGVAGVVAINTPDLDPNRGLVQLPIDLTDASRLIVQTCPTGDSLAKQPNEFIITGRGGLPPTPSEAVNRDAIQVDLVTADAGDRPSVSQRESDPNPVRLSAHAGALPPSSKTTLVEAQGLQVAADGSVFLVAAAPQKPMSPSLNRLMHCR